MAMANHVWPALPLAKWETTYATLHMWTQIVGKIVLAQTPLVNHWWNVAFYVTARGLTTPPIPYGGKTYGIEFDFIHHQLVITCDNGAKKLMALEPYSVAEFYLRFMQGLREVGMEMAIRPIPVEVENPVPFAEDREHRSYDREFTARFWHILLGADMIFKEFRARFIGKCSPVHFFWGSFDLAVTRFSGRPAPEREGADAITREAYSHEVISHGFWPGLRSSGAIEPAKSGSAIHAPAFYSYTVPEPLGLGEASVSPKQAFYSPEMKEWILLYDDMRKAESPEQALLDFLQSTYDAGADLAGWDRGALERKGR